MKIEITEANEKALIDNHKFEEGDTGYSNIYGEP